MFVITFGQLLNRDWYLSKHTFSRFPEFDLLSRKKMRSYLDPNATIQTGQTKLVRGTLKKGADNEYKLVPHHNIYVSDPLLEGGTSFIINEPIHIAPYAIKDSLIAEAFSTGADVFSVRLDLFYNKEDGFTCIGTEMNPVSLDDYRKDLSQNPMTASLLESMKALK